MTLLEELHEKIGRGGPNGLFPGAELRSISIGGTIRKAIVGETKSLPKNERDRIRQQNFKLWVEGDHKQTTCIIESPIESRPKHLLDDIMRIIR